MDWLAFIEKMLAIASLLRVSFCTNHIYHMKIVRTLVKPASLHVAFSTVPSQQSAV